MSGVVGWLEKYHHSITIIIPAARPNIVLVSIRVLILARGKNRAIASGTKKYICQPGLVNSDHR